MKSSEQILERFLSNESLDFFNTQRALLAGLLPFDLIKPYLNPEYVRQHEEGTLPQDERWETVQIDPQKELMDFLPEMNKLMGGNNIMEQTKGFLLIKTFIWIIDDGFYEEIESFFDEADFANAEENLRKINKHFGYSPNVETIEFEELPDQSGE